MPKSAAAFHRAAIAVAFIALPILAEAAAAQDRGATVSRELRPPTDGGARPDRMRGSRLPLAPAANVPRSAKNAAGVAPVGIAGFSASSPDGRRILPGRPGIARPPAYGSSTAPYTTARVAVTVRGESKRRRQDPVTSYPYRATGKLELRRGSIWFPCTASLVAPGVLITAAHCVHEFGEGDAGWIDEAWFSPASFSEQTGAAYGRFSAKTLRIPKSYFDGTDSCAVSGTMCSNDLATIVLDPSKGKNAGDLVGWYAYAWNGYSFEPSSFLGDVTAGQITQLGFPSSFDNGRQMQRTDAVGWYSETGETRNLEMGSAQTAGSSGGPWLVNFGTAPKVGAFADLGSDVAMAVVGVTSWGTVPEGINRQGASFFGQNKEFPKESYGSYGAGNIGKLMQDTCTSAPAAC